MGARRISSESRRRERSLWEVDGPRDPPRSSSTGGAGKRPRACVLTSTLPLALEVRTVPIATDAARASSSLPDSGVALWSKQSASVEESVFESERDFFPLVGWQEPKGQLDEFFTASFSRRRLRNKASTSHFPDVPLEEGWRWGFLRLERGYPRRR